MSIAKSNALFFSHHMALEPNGESPSLGTISGNLTHSESRHKTRHIWKDYTHFLTLDLPNTEKRFREAIWLN